MGFMTEVSILNDRWDEIRKEPEKFVEQLFDASMDSMRYSYIIGQTTVAKTHHADDLRVYFSGRNSFFDAYPSRDMDIDRLKRHLELIKEMKGYLKISEAATKETIAIREKKRNIESSIL